MRKHNLEFCLGNKQMVCSKVFSWQIDQSLSWHESFKLVSTCIEAKDALQPYIETYMLLKEWNFFFVVNKDEVRSLILKQVLFFTVEKKNQNLLSKETQVVYKYKWGPSRKKFHFFTNSDTDPMIRRWDKLEEGVMAYLELHMQ